MPRPGTLVLGAIGTLGVGYLGWKSASWIGLPAGSLSTWLLRSVVWILGLVIVFLILRLVRSSAPPREPSEPDPIDVLVERAKERLQAAGLGGRGVIGQRPLVLLLGPRDSAKTTFVQRSDLGTEHLAGDATASGIAPPTEALNVWFHEEHLLVEAGGAVVTEPDRWSRVVEAIQPAKWLPALLGRPQAPRVAIVCFSVDALRAAGPDDVVARAKELRARLTELSESIGIRLPVYVVFTKADAIEHFEDFVENLTEGEVHELLGANLRAPGDYPAGAYREREESRLGAAFDELFLSLAERRLDVLERAGPATDNGGAYEFPREFKKIAGRAKDFLVELCRPSQLHVSPFLRGFYFSGVRPVTVSEGEAARMPEARTAPSAEGATQIFDPGELRQERQPQRPQPTGGASRVPQWVFMNRILPSAVLDDRVAMGMTTGGFGLNVLRRFSLAVGLALVLLLGVALVASYSRERSLQEETRTAVEGARDLRAPDPALASLDDLERLDALRAVTARLSDYENHGRPLRSWLLMYTGGALHPAARSVYFDRFRDVLLERARDGVVASLEAFPEEPSLDQYDAVYNALKVHVETTDHPEEADSTFFGSVLTPLWQGSSRAGEERVALARRNFAFYGGELPHGDPYELEADDERIAASRDFLVRHTDIESFYRSMLAQWDGLAPVDFNRDHPGSERYIAVDAPVRGAFTRTGWDSIQASLESSDEALNLDRHVVGDDFFATLAEQGFEPEEMTDELAARYRNGYVAAWAAFLRSAEVRTPSLGAADDWMAAVGGRESALFRMFDVVDEQTTIGIPASDTAFRAVRMLTAPDTLDQLFSEEWGRPYLENVRALGQAAGRWADATGDPGATADLVAAAGEGEGFVRDMAVDFPTDPSTAREVGDAVTRLLSAPFDWAANMAAQGEALAANDLARQFCADHRGVFGAYPFDRSGPDADVGDVHALLQPGQGELFAFFDEVEGLGSDLNARYESFRRLATAISSSLYEEGTEGPNFRILLNVVSFGGADRVRLTVDGIPGTITPTERESETFRWQGSRAERVELVVDAGERTVVREHTGPWGLFQLFHQADWRSVGSGRYEVTWSLDGIQLVAEVRFTGEPILDPSYLSSVSCPVRVAD